MSDATGSIVFYCKDCEGIVDTDRVGRKYVYKCKKCGTKNVAFGTKKSIYSFFHVEDKEEEGEGEERVAEKKSKTNEAPEEDKSDVKAKPSEVTDAAPENGQKEEVEKAK